MRRDSPCAVHSLLRVNHLDALVFESSPPSWASAALRCAPWTVVRREAPRRGFWPVGVRGSVRSQRSAAWLAADAVEECITPQMLVTMKVWRRLPRGGAAPAISVLDDVAEILDAHGYSGCWGPGGSVGFELASGVRCTTARSDLDVVLRADQPMARADAAGLHAELSRLPVRIDLLLETPLGAAGLAEFAKHADAMLLRSAEGPRLVRDPWSADDAMAVAR